MNYAKGYAILLLAAGQLSAASVYGESRVQEAVAHLSPTAGNSVRGVVRFEAVEEGLRVSAELSGLAPGPHGFHIHEFGDCSAADAASAGGHFDPRKREHGAPQAAQRHAGDLGNITAGPDGKAALTLTSDYISFEGPASVLGRSVLVHEKADDFKTQPTGNAGARLACGVIGVTK